MTITPTLYIGSYEVGAHIGVPTGLMHSYLIYDPDLDDDQNPATFNASIPTTIPSIIRGGPESGISSGQVVIETRNLTNSTDDFGFGELTAADRNFRVISEGSEATTNWTLLTTFAHSLGAYNSLKDQYESILDYELLGPNSNSVTNSVLNSIGLDFRSLTPLSDLNPSLTENPNQFPGQTHILDGSGNDTFTAFAYSSAYTFHDSTGSDTIKVENGARLEIVKYADPLYTGSNKVVMLDVALDKLVFDLDSDDLQVQKGLAELVILGDQYGANGLAADLLEFGSADDRHFKTINLALLADDDILNSVTLDRIYTAYTGHADVTGDNSADHIYGDAAANILSGLSGDDYLDGGSGSGDQVYGDAINLLVPVNDNALPARRRAAA